MIAAQIIWECNVCNISVFIHTYKLGYFRRPLCLWSFYSYGVILCIFIDLGRKNYLCEFTLGL